MMIGRQPDGWGKKRGDAEVTGKRQVRAGLPSANELIDWANTLKMIRSTFLTL